MYKLSLFQLKKKDKEQKSGFIFVFHAGGYIVSMDRLGIFCLVSLQIKELFDFVTVYRMPKIRSWVHLKCISGVGGHTKIVF